MVIIILLFVIIFGMLLLRKLSVADNQSTPNKSATARNNTVISPSILSTHLQMFPYEGVAAEAALFYKAVTEDPHASTLSSKEQYLLFPLLFLYPQISQDRLGSDPLRLILSFSDAGLNESITENCDPLIPIIDRLLFLFILADLNVIRGSSVEGIDEMDVFYAINQRQAVIKRGIQYAVDVALSDRDQHLDKLNVKDACIYSQKAVETLLQDPKWINYIKNF